MTRELFKAHSGDGPIERDWRLGSGNADLSRMDVSEKYLAPGETITAWGRYSRAKNALTTDLDDVGFLRVERSAVAKPVPAFPSEALGHLVGGIVLVAIGNALFAAGWFLAP